MKAIVHANIYDYVGYKQDQYVLYDGGILAVGDMADYRRPRECTEELDVKGALLMPSLVIGHAHLYGAYLRAFRPKTFQPLTFRELLQQLFWELDGALDLDGCYHSARAMALDHIRSGVTTIFDHHASGAAIRGTLEQLRRGWVEESGLRGAFCFETSDRFDVDACIEENVSFHKAHKADGWSCGMFGMHASMTLSERTLRKVRERIEDIPLHVHVAESLEDQEECIALYGKRIVERFLDHGIVSPGSIFAHCVNINEREAFLMAENGVTAALNTVSNINCGHGVADYRALRRFGVSTMIGNDSLGANIAADYRIFVFAQHLRSKNVWHVNTEDLLCCIRNGYAQASRALGVPLGRIEPGYAADMLTVEYNPYTPMEESSVFDHVFDALFQQFRPRNVWCAGIQKLKDYSVTLDEERICFESRGCAQRIWQSI
ncbi:MAG: amidohydrolase family protein [Bacillota bacterium]